METEFNKLKILDNDTVNTKNCSYCNKPFTEELWCKECDPYRIMEGVASGNPDIDKFIKDTMCKPAGYKKNYSYPFLEWVPYEKFTDIKEIGEGGFAKVFSATWIDSKSKYYKNDDGSWRKSEPRPEKVALKRLNGSQNMSDKYINEVSFLTLFLLFIT
jgi:serine/threonine protein kinase